MGTIHHLLHPDERLIVACFTELGRFRQSYDPAILNALRARFAARCSGQAEELVSQALLVDRIFALTGMSAPPAEREESVAGAEPAGAMRLLAAIEAAQTSRLRLEAILNGEGWLDPAGTTLVVRFAALLLGCGLRLPPRQAFAGARPASRGLRPRAVETRRVV